MKTYPPAHTARLLAPFMSLLLLAATPANAGDVFYYGVQKGQYYLQSSLDAAELAPDNPYVFEAFVEGTGDGAIEEVYLTKPGSSPSTIPGSGTSYFAQVVFSSLNSLNSLYRSGSYRFQIYSENDIYTETFVNLSGDTYPPAPHVTNYTAAQAINPAAAFTVRWEPFTGGTTDDTIELYVYDNGGSVVYTDSGLDGTVTSDTIPANTLSPGTTYPAEVIFWKSVDFLLDPGSGAFGLSFYYKTTQFTVTTTGSSTNSPPPTISSPQIQLNGQFQLHIEGVAGRSYRVESTTDFSSWTQLQTIIAPVGGGLDFLDNQPLSASARFYRVVLLPP